MAKVNLSNMTVGSLMELRKRADKALLERRAEMEKQLARMDRSIALLGSERDGRRGRRTSLLKGRKVAPKYRGPAGETWAGRGARPRWLVAAVKEGRKLDDFLIDKLATKGRKRRRSKR
jgi:DNA-binding protein H-NS